MSSTIKPIPSVPEAIKNAITNGTLAVFIGAGVSRLVGCDGWDTLARNLVRRCHKQDIINFKESETLLQGGDHKKTITICHHLFTTNGLADIFYEEMSEALKEGHTLTTPNIYDDIYRLRGLFLTTNADSHFDRLFDPPKRLFLKNDFKEDNLNLTNLYHIHGSIKDRDSLIFTVSEYMRRYTDPYFRRFLERIFLEYTVLFLGYGVAEFEVLDFVLKDSFKKKEVTPKHFILSPFYSGEENILRYEQAYYNDLDINIIGYQKDLKGYNQLVDVIKHWNDDINKVTGYLHAAALQIDKAVI